MSGAAGQSPQRGPGAEPLVRVRGESLLNTVAKSVLEFFNVKQLIGLVTIRHKDHYPSPY